MVSEVGLAWVPFCLVGCLFTTSFFGGKGGGGQARAVETTRVVFYPVFWELPNWQLQLEAQLGATIEIGATPSLFVSVLLQPLLRGR